MFTINGAMAKLESNLISEGVRAGMAAAKARASTWGGQALRKGCSRRSEKKAPDKPLSANAIARMYTVGAHQG